MNQDTTKTILLVEDEEAHVGLIRRAFRNSNNIELLVAYTIEDAQKILSSTKLDLIITDWLLPDGKGIILLACCQDYNLPVIVMTSHGDEHIAVDAIKAGALDYVVKSGETLSDMPHLADRALREWENITERKRAEGALAREHSLLRTLVDTLPDPIFVKDTESRYLFSNFGLARFLNVDSPKDIIGKTVFDFYSPEAAQVFFDEEQKVIETGKPVLGRNVQVQMDHGVEKWFSVSIVPWKDNEGHIVGVVGLNRDITEIRFAEEELLESERRFRTLLENIPNLAVQGYKPDGTVHYWNKASESIYGYTSQEAVGQQLVDLIVPPEMRKQVSKIIEVGVRTNKMPAPEEMLLMAKDKSLVPVFSSHTIITRKRHGAELFCIDLDLRDLKSAQEKLQRSEHLFRTVINATSEAMILINVSGEITLVNPAAEDMFGFDKDELMGLKLETLIPNDYSTIFNTYIDTYFEHDKPIAMKSNVIEVMGCHRDKHTIPMEISLASGLIGKDKFVIAVARDISERKKAEEEREKAITERLAVFDAMNEGLLITDKNHNIISYNRAIEEMWAIDKINPADFVGRNIKDLPHYSQDDRQDFIQFIDNFITNSSKDLLELKTATGRWESITMSLLRDKEDNPTVLFAVIRDITDRQLTIKALQDTNELLEKIFSITYISIAYMDTDFNFTRVNRAYAQADDKNTRFFVGKNHFDLYPNEENFKLFKQVVETGVPYVARDKPFIYAHDPQRGISLWDWTLQPVNDANGNVEGLLLCLSDITERKRAEKDLLNYQKQLRSLASELSVTEEQERRKIAADLHDSIGQTLAFTQIKLEQIRDANKDDELACPLKEISKLIEQIIKDTHSLIFELSPPVLHELGFEAAVEWLTEQIQQQHGLRCIFDDDGEPKPQLNTDCRVVLFRAIRELLINVAKHAQATHATISVNRSQENIEVVVEDDGVGMNDKTQNGSSGKKHGFGLFNIRERLDHFGGHLEMSSEKGKGSRFTIILPFTH